VVFVVSICGDQLHKKLDVRRFCGGWIVGWSIFFHDFAGKGARWFHGEECLVDYGRSGGGDCVCDLEWAPRVSTEPPTLLRNEGWAPGLLFWLGRFFLDFLETKLRRLELLLESAPSFMSWRVTTLAEQKVKKGRRFQS
jgi:hypothetical protein